MNNAYRNGTLDMNGWSLTEKKAVFRDGNSIYATALGSTTEKTVGTDTSKLDSANCLTDKFNSNLYGRTLEKPVV